MTTNLRTKIFLLIFLVLFGIAMRFLPHSWNFTPMNAIMIFASAYLGVRYSVLALFGIMLVSDFFLGFYDLRIMFFVYGSFVLASFIGLMLRKKRTVGLVLAGSLFSSFLFFATTNWAVWQFGSMYAHSIDGLFESYLMAIPFFKNSVAGDIFYSGILFGTYEMCVYFLKKRKERPALSKSTT